MNFTPKPIRVAYAEDHVMLRTALSENLENSGIVKVVLQADNGIDLIRALQQAEELPEVVLMDIEMPGMNGFETSRELKKRWPRLRILALTGHESEAVLHKMIRCGADGHITKRADTSELLKAINDLNNGEVYNTELLSEGRSSFLPPDLAASAFNPMEVRLLQASAQERTVEEMARMMGHKPKSVSSSLYRLYKKAGVQSAKGLLLYAIRYGFVSTDEL